MATFDYARMAALSVRLLEKFGAQFTLTRTTIGTRDVESGTVSGSSPSAYTVTGAKFDYRQKDIDGTVIQAGDQRFLMAPDAAVTPQTGDQLTIDGEDWNVVTSRPLKSASVIVLHEVQIRQ